MGSGPSEAHRGPSEVHHWPSGVRHDLARPVELDPMILASVEADTAAVGLSPAVAVPSVPSSLRIAVPSGLNVSETMAFALGRAGVRRDIHLGLGSTLQLQVVSRVSQ